MADRELYNVLDKLKEISESGYESEDVATAIEQIDAYSFKARLAEMEKQEESAKPDYIDLDKDGDKEEPMKQAAKDAEKVDEDDVEEGNAFSGALAAAKASGKGEFEVDGKKYQVTEVEDSDTPVTQGDIDDFFNKRPSDYDLGEDPWGLGEDGVGYADGDYRDEEDDRYDQDGNWVDDYEDDRDESEIDEAVNPVDVKDAMKHLWELLQSGLDPETKEAVQNAYIELKHKAAAQGGNA